MITKRKVLITGGMGFVGGRVAQILAARGDVEVMLGSRNAQISPSWLASADVVAMDWLAKESLLAACDGVDTIVHLAAMNDIDCLCDPVAALEVNGVNTVRLLEAAKASGVARFIYFSTTHVYGSPLVGRIDETLPLKCQHPYATSHRAAEDVVLAANEKLVSIVLRLSNGFGVPAHSAVNVWTLLVNDLCRQAVTQRSLTLRSSGLQKRDFVTLHDAAYAVSHMIDLPKAIVGDGIYNVGGGLSTRVIDMAEMIQSRCSEVLGFTPEILRPKPTINETSPDLDYRIDKLLATGFSLQGKFEDEIDEILLLCQKTFG
jgi:UDP-glucose 4-epimerase